MGNTLFDDEHSALLGIAGELVDALRRFGSRIQSEDVSYEQHRVYAARAGDLAVQLHAALTMVRAEMYGPAFALLRTGMEQVVFDRLLCLGTTYTQRIVGMSQQDFEVWRHKWRSKEAGTEQINDLTRDGGTGVVRVVRHGVTSSDPKSEVQVISIYFFLLNEYQPFVMPAADQRFLLPSSSNAERQRAFAEEQHLLYHSDLRWESLLRNLKLNQLGSAQDVLRLEVHSRFLSSFVHPLKDHYRLLYGRHIDLEREPRYDHFSSELALLYVIAFATYEVETLQRASSRAPQFRMTEADQLRQLITVARDNSSYLWFVGDPPHDFDRLQEANHRHWSSAGTRAQPLSDWRSLSDDDVRYYQDPLRRLIRLHMSTNEMMGHSFMSAWPRPDAQLR
jgi:hypothetical protein